jgi:hypothetical protein
VKELKKAMHVCVLISTETDLYEVGAFNGSDSGKSPTATTCTLTTGFGHCTCGDKYIN